MDTAKSLTVIVGLIFCASIAGHMIRGTLGATLRQLGDWLMSL